MRNVSCRPNKSNNTDIGECGCPNTLDEYDEHFDDTCPTNVKVLVVREIGKREQYLADYIRHSTVAIRACGVTLLGQSMPRFARIGRTSAANHASSCFVLVATFSNS